MSVVETIAKIRRLPLVQGKSIKATCRELKISRKVVRKVLRSDQTEFRYERRHQPYSRMGAWRDELDRLLSTNAGKSQRERLTLIRDQQLFGAFRPPDRCTIFAVAPMTGACAASLLIPCALQPSLQAIVGCFGKFRAPISLSPDWHRLSRDSLSILRCLRAG